MSRFKVLVGFFALALLLVAAYAGPGRIDQGRLRAWIAPELERAFRQGAAIDGAIDFALLPRPMVKVRQVRIARDGKLSADIPEIEANVKLWPLLFGKLEPESLVLSRPDIHLEAPPVPAPVSQVPAPPSDSIAVPAAAAPSKPGLAAPRPGIRVVIEKGALTVPGPGGQPLRLAPVDLKLLTSDNSLSLSGRVALAQTGIQIDGDAHWLDGALQSTALTLHVDGGAVLHWTGQGDPLSEDHPLAGKLTARLDDPATLLGDMPAVPVGLSGEITLKPGQVEAKNLLLSVGDAELRGEGHLDEGDVPRATLSLHAAVLDLRKSASAPPLAAVKPAPADSQTPPPPALTPAAKPAKTPGKPALPLLRQASVALSLSADQILWRGQVLQDAKIDLAAANNEIILKQATVTLPGASQLSVVGSVGEGARFEGSFEAKSDDLRALLRWAAIEPANVPADRLRSARLAGQLSGDLTQIALEGVRVKVDSSQLDLSAAIRPGPRPAFGVTFAIDQLNGDAYWPANPPAAAAKPAETAAAVPADLPAPVSAPAVAQDFGIDAEIQGKIGHLSWRGQSVQDLALDVALSPDGALVHSLTVADLAGAHASFSGLLKRGADGLHVEHGKASLHSRDIARTARLLGADVPFDGQADLGAEIGGPLVSPAMKVTAPVLTIGKTWFDHVSVDLSLPPGKLAFDHLTAGLYGGQLTGQASLARDGGTSSAHLALAGAQVKKALLGVADIGLADGDLSGETSLTSAGKSEAEIKANLSGTLSLAVKNGQIKGFDLKAANDRLNGKEGIGGLLALLSAGLTGGETHFSSLTGTAKADHGVIVTNDLSLIAEGGDAKGVATINLPADTIDARADFRFANAHDAPPLTMRLTGSLQSPHRYLDVKPLQQWLAEHGVKTGKPKDVLKGLLQGLVK